MTTEAERTHIKRKCAMTINELARRTYIRVRLSDVLSTPKTYWCDKMYDGVNKLLNDHFLPSNGIKDFDSRDFFIVTVGYSTDAGSLGMTMHHGLQASSTTRWSELVREITGAPINNIPVKTNNGEPVVVFSFPRLLHAPDRKLEDRLTYSDDLRNFYCL